ncbi:hypothetical protein CkaCkLH20_06283 [Colletotrichum karsti]|uniref:Uncharacterized protein n=1 Tax=Colletotrichum karsti TaxID=1095194 RepID=A0A9P6ICW9_9PEZI|nr:uncharacterized protein CkaCkLH20_06283 [Colletotrichum karsti]KAF9876340.1 hypothetical protein CkaCkLH20_06283 [Colletotrichum karsti]
MTSKAAKMTSPENADGSGPSELRQREKNIEKAINRVYKASRNLILGLHAMFTLLGLLGIDIDIESLPADDETASAAWRENREEFRITLIQVYEASDRVLDMALRTEKHMAAAQHENMMRDVLFVRRLIMDVLPQELYDHVVGKGKEVRGKGFKKA